MINGLHHLTAIASDAQANVNFYVGVLGLRLVKKTINFDDPNTYHLYYGDNAGTPSTILTFFPWPGATRGHGGVGETMTTALLVPHGSLDRWKTYLREQNVPVDEPTERMGQQYLRFSDPDGMGLELTEGEAENAVSENKGAAIVRMAGVTLRVADTTATESLLTSTLGFAPVGTENGVSRFASGNSWVDLSAVPDHRRAQLGAGSVHHVAWRVGSDNEQAAVLETLHQARVGVTDVKDRQYFHSIYFREPGGVLFEVATDPPGFAVDEPLEKLGTTLRLPQWLENDRAALEKRLAPLTVPARGGA